MFNDLGTAATAYSWAVIEDPSTGRLTAWYKNKSVPISTNADARVIASTMTYPEGLRTTCAGTCADISKRLKSRNTHVLIGKNTCGCTGCAGQLSPAHSTDVPAATFGHVVVYKA